MAVRRRLAAVAAVAGLGGPGRLWVQFPPVDDDGDDAGRRDERGVLDDADRDRVVDGSRLDRIVHHRDGVSAELARHQRAAGPVGAGGRGLPQPDGRRLHGVVPGRTYYAYDPATSTYWAGAALVPSSSSMPAQVSSQDDGSYLLFTRPANGAWTVYSVGMTGIAGAKCPVPVPASVLAVWGWAPGTCRPAS